MWQGTAIVGKWQIRTSAIFYSENVTIYMMI